MIILEIPLSGQPGRTSAKQHGGIRPRTVTKTARGCGDPKGWSGCAPAVALIKDDQVDALISCMSGQLRPPAGSAGKANEAGRRPAHAADSRARRVPNLDARLGASTRPRSRA